MMMILNNITGMSGGYTAPSADPPGYETAAATPYPLNPTSYPPYPPSEQPPYPPTQGYPPAPAYPPAPGYPPAQQYPPTQQYPPADGYPSKQTGK